MSRQIQVVIGAIVVIVLIVAGAVFVLKKSQKPQEPTARQQASPAPAAGESGTIKSLLAMGKDVSCEVSYYVGKTKTSGKVYVSGKKMRGDFDIALEDGKQMDSHMIQDETFIYSWSSVLPQGTKMKIEAVSASPAPGAAAQNQSFDMNQNVSYKCSDWSADDSKFISPAGVQFLDVSVMMKAPAQAKPATDTTSSPCDAIVDPQAKAACISATQK